MIEEEKFEELKKWAREQSSGNLVERAIQQRDMIREKYPEVLLLFRIGDFLEAFEEDAKIIAAELDLTLTKRLNFEVEVAMCGFPYHRQDPYIKKLTDVGHQVAICEELK